MLSIPFIYFPFPAMLRIFPKRSYSRVACIYPPKIVKLTILFTIIVRKIFIPSVAYYIGRRMAAISRLTAIGERS